MIPKLSTVGGMAVGIPGAVAGILEVHENGYASAKTTHAARDRPRRKRLCCYRKTSQEF